MVVGTSAEGPVVLALGILDRQIVDRSQVQAHEACIVELPILVAVRSEPASGIVVPFIGKSNGDAIAFRNPEFFDQSVVELLRPLALQKRDDLLPSVNEFRPVPPAGVDRVGE
jgi:hypothetical protein